MYYKFHFETSTQEKVHNYYQQSLNNVAKGTGQY